MNDATKAVFLSYAHEDTAAARRIADALRAFGVEVWFDQSELRGGDAWDAQIKKQIRECAFFVPVISATTQSRKEGYFRREWKLAVERTHDMAGGVPFLLPIVVDETTEAAAVVPDEFKRVQWVRLPHGVPSTQFIEQVKRLAEPRQTISLAARPAMPAVPARTSAARGVFAAVVVALIAGALWWKFGSRAPGPSAPAGPPVVVLMDTPYPDRVYDSATLKGGGTNADDITDALRELPVKIVKEATGALWHREAQVLEEGPALIVLHRSCFYTFPGSQSEELYPVMDNKLVAFLGYVATRNPRTQFIVYSRSSFEKDSDAAKWRNDAAERFPALAGRIETWRVPLDRATFRDPLTGRELKESVERALGMNSKSRAAK